MFEQFGILNPWLYIIGALMIILVPGPNTLAVLKTSIVDGRKPAICAVLAVMLGDSILILLAYLGIAALLKAHPALYSCVKVGGGLFLAWMGTKALWQTFCVRRTSGEPVAMKAKTPVKKGTCRRAFMTTLALSLTNPKSIIFYVSFFVQFIDETYAHPGVSYLILATILQTFSVTWFTILITVGTDVLRMIARAPALAKLGNTAVGSLFLFFASKLMLEA